jgi:predicted amidohydrolase YtcJ
MAGQTRKAFPVALAVLSAACSTAEPSPVADLVFKNAKVYTVDDSRPWASAVAIKDGRIVLVGTDAEAARHEGAATRVIDLGGKVMLPAFGDAHAHPAFGGISYSRCSLHEGERVEDYAQIISGCIARTPGSGVIYGVGWRDGYFPPNGVPHKNVLDAITRERPLVFLSVGGHSLWLNSKALELAGITKDTPDPPNGHIDRDPATGEPIGGLQEAAMDLMKPHIPPPTDEETRDSIVYAAKLFNSLGIVSWQDAGVEVAADGTSGLLDAYRQVRDLGALTAHVSLALKWENERSYDQLPVLVRTAERARASGLRTDTIKFYIDGVIPQKTAAMLEPYENAGQNRGETQIPSDVFRNAVKEFDARGMQVHVHAIGDRGVREALDAIAAAKTSNGVADNRHQISHMNLIAPADQPRFAQLGVVATFQPLWASWDPYMRLTAQGVGSRMSYIYPAGSLVRSGATLAYGADWPVASANPLEGIEVAMTRRAPGTQEGEPLSQGEAVTLEQAIKAYTLNVAYVNHMESETGSISLGKNADLVVLDRDLFSIPAQEISRAKVLSTLFEGREVFGSLTKTH